MVLTVHPACLIQARISRVARWQSSMSASSLLEWITCDYIIFVLFLYALMHVACMVLAPKSRVDVYSTPNLAVHAQMLPSSILQGEVFCQIDSS